jgi:hypothetical protein
MALQFTRNASVFVEVVDGITGAPIDAWKLSVLDGFSFTQSINSSEITINEAGQTSRRARLLFNDSLAPVEWSLSTYARPTVGVSVVATTLTGARMPEEALWAMAVGSDSYDRATGVFSNSAAAGSPAVNVHTTTTSNTINFNGSNVSSFSDNWNLYFAFEDGANTQYYKLNNSVVNSMSMDFDIDGIATVSWSGFSKSLEDVGTVKPGFIDASVATEAVSYAITGGSNTATEVTATVASTTGIEVGSTVFIEGNATASTNDLNGAKVTSVAANTSITYENTGNAAPTATGTIGTTPVANKARPVIATGLTSTTNFIRNRISTVTMARLGALAETYDLVLTGGNFTLENNINYLTPEELGNVNAPLANITGARSISGSMTCYLDNDGTGNTKSGGLFADLVADTATIRNDFDMQLQMGGSEGDTPRVYLDLPHAHVEIPTINVEDLLTLEINFHGQVANGNVDNTDEATIIYNT